MDTDWQRHIHGIGLHEFVLQDSEDVFIEAINRHVSERDEIRNFGDIKSAPHVPQYHGGLTREISLPEEYNHCFDEVYLYPVTETNQAVRLTFYGRIDTETFLTEREEIYREPDYNFDKGNAGLETLRTAETRFSEFLHQEIGAGLFTEGTPEWATRNQDIPSHPAFWYYDLADTEIQS